MTQLKAWKVLLMKRLLSKKKVNALIAEKKKNLKSELLNSVTQINGINFISAIVDLESDAMKDLSFACKNEVNHLVMVLGAENKGKANLTVIISDDLIEQNGLNAGQIIREIATEIRGGGAVNLSSLLLEGKILAA